MRRPPCFRSLIAAAVIAAAVAPAAAVSTQYWVRAGDTLRTGTGEGMVVTPDGLLAPGPRAEVLARPDAGVLWGVAAAGQDVLVGGGDKVGLLRVNAKGATPIAGLTAGPEVFAVVRGAKGEIYAATGPDGAVYRVDLSKNQASELFKVPAKYIWALLPMNDGSLLVATGLPGKVLRFDGKGAPSPVWETTEDHVRSLALGSNGKILAGTSGAGRLVELDGKGAGFVLWDSGRAETVSIAVDGRGVIWAAFAGAAGKGEGTPSAPPKQAPRNAGTTSVTVRARAVDDKDAAQTEGQATQKKEEEAGQPPKATELPGAGGAVVRLAPGEEPETIWSDDKETPLALAGRSEGGVFLGLSGPAARILWFDRGGRLGFFDERKENRAVSALAVDGERIFAAASNPAAVVVYGPDAASPARWMSDVFDMKVRSTVGHVHAFTERKNAGAVSVFVRVGNTVEPGPGWTEWTEAPQAAGPPEIDGGRAEGLPLARFFQVRVDARSSRPYAFGVDRVLLHHRPVNRPPKIDSIDALPQGVALRSMPPAPMSSGEVPVIAPPRTPELDRVLGDALPPWRSKRAYEPGAMTVGWEAKDPDGDGLMFKVDYCRDEGGACSNWTLLAEDLDQNFYSFDSRTLADGAYRFRVTADDADDNAAGQGLTAERVSEPMAVDNTPPVIERAEYTRRPDGKIEVRVVGRDPGGRLSKAEVSRAAGVFITLAAADGVGDAEQETFVGVVPAPEKGQDVLVRLIDGAGNNATRRAQPQ